MTLVVLGLDALDSELVDPDEHPSLTLAAHRPIDTIVSEVGEPATHELWPTIITGLPPAEHGLQLGTGGIGWENPLLSFGARVADYVLPDAVQSKLGAWILDRTDTDAFRTAADYYPNNGLTTLFDGRRSRAIGVPNYVVDPDEEDREHLLRQRLGDYLDFDPGAEHTHTTDDLVEFYERCLEMSMVRIARTRRALRGGRYELVFGYTSGLDLVGHVTFDRPAVQRAAYDELDTFVGELVADLDEADELLLVSDHGLQDGLHTETAMVAGTDPETVAAIDSVLDIRAAVEAALGRGDHATQPRIDAEATDADRSREVRDQLEDLGYM
jgi:hypothetical protein